MGEQIHDWAFWNQIIHHVFYGMLFMWVGWKLGKRQFRKEIARGHVDPEEILPPECAAVLMDDDE